MSSKFASTKPVCQAIESYSVLTLLQTCGSLLLLSGHRHPVYVPSEGTGIAWGHIPDSVAANKVAISIWLDSSKSVPHSALTGSCQLVYLRLNSAVGRSVPPLSSSDNVSASTNSVVAANRFTWKVKASTKEFMAWKDETKARSETSTARFNSTLPKLIGIDAGHHDFLSTLTYIFWLLYELLKLMKCITS